MKEKIDQLLQFSKGIIWDGNLISKTSRDILVKNGLVDKLNGWNFITKKGVEYLLNLNLIQP